MVGLADAVTVHSTFLQKRYGGVIVRSGPNMATFEAVMKTEAAAEAMAYDGVLPETLVITVEA